MATTLTPLYPLEAPEEVLHRIPRIEWLEWFEALEFRGPVDVLPAKQSAAGAWVLDRADFDPFDDVLELVLSHGRDTVRLLIDVPREVLAATEGSAVLHLTVLADSGPIVVRSAEEDLALRAD
jgi:hypothetical protein